MSNTQLNAQDAPFDPENQANQIAMSSVPSFQSINSMGEGRVEEEERVDLQVVQAKSDRKINHEEILKMFNEQVEKEEKEREEIELKRRESLKNKTNKGVSKPVAKKHSHQERKVNNKDVSSERLQALSQKSLRLKKRIQQHCRHYKSMYRPSIYDTKLQKFRFQCKQKLFFYLCFGYQQLKQLSPQELTPVQRQVLNQNCYDLCRKLTFDVDLELLRILNKSDKYEISREYKQQFQTLINNLKDQNNHELKRKILTRMMTGNRIAMAGEIQFFTTAKREELLEKQKRYIAEFTVENVLKPLNEDNQEFMQRPRDYEGPREELSVPKSSKPAITNKYLQESSVLQLQELLSEHQLSKMMRRLQEDLQGKSKSLLISNFKEVFGV